MKKILMYNFLVLVMFNFATPIIPEMLVAKDFISGANSFMYGAFSLGIFLFSPFWGRYINQNGVKLILIWSPLLYTFTQLLMCFSMTSVMVIFARFLAGFVTASFFLGCSSYINLYANSEDKAKYFGYVFACSSIAAIVSQLFSGFLSTYFNSYYFAFIIQFIGGIILVFVGYLIFRYLKHDTKDIKENVKEKIKLEPIFVIVALLAASITIYTVNIGYYAVVELGADTSDVGNINALNNALTLFANIFIIKYLDRLFTIKKSFYLQIIFGILGISLFIVGIYNANNILIYTFLTIFVIALSLHRPLAQKYVVTQYHDNANVYLAYVASSSSIGMVFGSFLAGICFMINHELPFICILILLLIALFVQKKYLMAK